MRTCWGVRPEVGMTEVGTEPCQLRVARRDEMCDVVRFMGDKRFKRMSLGLLRGIGGWEQC